MVSEKRFIVESVSIIDDCNEDKSRIAKVITDTDENYSYEDLYEVAELLNEQQELIEELQVSDEMGWKRAEHFEKKCPKELHNKKMYIKRLEYKVQKFKEMNSEQQATIRKLQDLCGESDSENMKLRLENKRLQEELNDCEKFRYTVFKRMGELNDE